jgi:hypothetical protein
VDLRHFRARFPEFNQAPDSLVQATLDGCSVEFAPTIWGNKLDEGHGYLTAHKLSLSPFGQQARLAEGKRGETTYFLEYQRLVRTVAHGFRVAG